MPIAELHTPARARPAYVGDDPAETARPTERLARRGTDASIESGRRVDTAALPRTDLLRRAEAARQALRALRGRKTAA